MSHLNSAIIAEKKSHDLQRFFLALFPPLCFASVATFKPLTQHPRTTVPVFFLLLVALLPLVN